MMPQVDACIGTELLGLAHAHSLSRAHTHFHTDTAVEIAGAGWKVDEVTNQP